MSHSFQEYDCFANANTLWAAIFVHALSLAGLRDICLSPGSRSAPIALACAAHSGLCTHLLIDERSAAFFALGLAKASHKPTAVLCTSGTAPANFFPAIVEASQACLPLVAISADRPSQLHHCGANQTTQQYGMFATHDRWHVNAGEPRMTTPDLLSLFSLAAKLIKKALHTPQGPVHINLPFSKPLEPVPTDIDLLPAVKKTAVQLLHKSSISLRASVNPVVASLSASVLASLASTVAKYQRGLIVCGPHTPLATVNTEPTFPLTTLAKNITQLAEQLAWPILAEPSSGVWQNGNHPNLMPAANALLQTKSVRKALPPQYILRFGALPIQTELNLLLRDIPQTIIDSQGRWSDPYHNPHAQHLQAEPALLAAQLLQALRGTTKGNTAQGNTAKENTTKETAKEDSAKKDSAWLALFSSASQAIQQTISEAIQQEYYLPQPPDYRWFEGQFITQLATLLPHQALLFTASSLCLRYLADYWHVHWHVHGRHERHARAVTHLANRGNNGIDGVLSSALGAAKHHNQPSFLLIGDTALLHDSNALHLNQQTQIPLKILLVNNNGGGIFQTLPIRDYPQFQPLFVAPHYTRFQKLAQAHLVAYHQPKNWQELSLIIGETLNNTGIEMIEIKTDYQISDAKHQGLQNACKELGNKSVSS